MRSRLPWRTRRGGSSVPLTLPLARAPPSPRSRGARAFRGAFIDSLSPLTGRGRVRGGLVRVDDRAQHDAALLRVIVAGTPVHRRPLVPDQEIADLPGMAIGEAFLGGVRGELLDQL